MNCDHGATSPSSQTAGHSPAASSEAVHAFRAGASGFLLKTAPPPQLVAAIRTVHAGDGLLAPASTRRLIEQSARPPVPAPRSTR